jgi:hypothetical protein
MKEYTDIQATSFWEFRKLLKLSYDLGYKFRSGNKYTAFELWFIKKCNGLSLENDLTMRYIERHLDIDSIDLNEFLRVVHGFI